MEIDYKAECERLEARCKLFEERVSTAMKFAHDHFGLRNDRRGGLLKQICYGQMIYHEGKLIYKSELRKQNG